MQLLALAFAAGEGGWLDYWNELGLTDTVGNAETFSSLSRTDRGVRLDWDTRLEGDVMVADYFVVGRGGRRVQRPDYLYHPSGVRYGKGGGCQTQKQPPPGNSAVTDPPLGLHIKDIVIHILPRVRCRRLDRKGDRFALGHRRPPLKENFVPHIMVCGRAKKMHCPRRRLTV